MLGSAASALQTLDANAALRRQKLDSVKQYVRYKRVPAYLREKIVEYYEYMYTRIQSIDEAKVLKKNYDKTEDDLLAITNFGQKSLDEVVEKLDERGLTLRIRG